MVEALGSIPGGTNSLNLHFFIIYNDYLDTMDFALVPSFRKLHCYFKHSCKDHEEYIVIVNTLYFV